MSRLEGNWPVMLSLVIVAVFYLSVGFFSINIPNSDDFNVYLEFLLRLQGTTEFGQWATLLFTPHNEHYIVVPRLVALLQWLICGEINFVWLNIIGSLALLVCLVLFYCQSTLDRWNRRYLFLVLSLMICHPQYSEATIWATAALSNLWVIAFAMLSFAMAGKGTVAAFAEGGCLAILATFTQGNGILVLPLLLLTEVFAGRFRRAIFVAVLFVVLFFFMQSDTVGHLNGLAELGLFPYFIQCLDYSLTFLGSTLSFGSHQMAVGMGFVVILGAISLTWVRYDQINVTIFSLLLFCIATALAQSLVRGHLGVDYALVTSRYKIVSIVAFACLFAGIVESSSNVARQRGLLLIGVLCAGVTCFTSWLNNSIELPFRRQFLADSLQRWQLVGAALEHPMPELADRIMREAVDAGIYHLPAVGRGDLQRAAPLAGVPEAKGQIVHALEHLVLTDRFLFIRGWAFVFGEESIGSRISVTLVGAENRYVIPTANRLRCDVTAYHRVYFDQGNLDYSGFQVLLERKELFAGNYRIGVMLEKGDERLFVDTGKTVDISAGNYTAHTLIPRSITP
ncbi:MAG: hypothetical protein PHC51_01920 [bacterium]|nr:hypothetical protein [bacterium]